MGLKKIIDIAYSSAIFAASLVTKDDETWLFGAQGGYSYSDNAKYFFEWILVNHPQEVCFWVTKDKDIHTDLLSKNLPALYFYDIKNILLMARAKYVVCTHSHTGNDVYKFIKKSKTLITLWHGIPLKKMGNSLKRKNKKYRKYIKIKSQPDLFLVTSPTDKELFSEVYEIDKDKFFIGTYPRINDLITRAKDKKSILYAPTFRDEMGQEYYDKHVFPTLQELQKLNDILVQFNYRLFVKMHPYLKADFPDLSDLSHMELVSAFDDVQSYLAQASILITDYSSIYFDYLNLDREIIFFIPDYDWYYQESNRGLIYKYEDVTPGYKVTNWSQISVVLLGMLEGNQVCDFSKDRKEVLDFFFSNRELDNSDLFDKCKSISQ